MPALCPAAPDRLVPLVLLAHLRLRANRFGRGAMLDFVYLAVAAGNFALLAAYIRFCERV